MFENGHYGPTCVPFGVYIPTCVFCVDVLRLWVPNQPTMTDIIRTEQRVTLSEPNAILAGFQAPVQTLYRLAKLPQEAVLHTAFV